MATVSCSQTGREKHQRKSYTREFKLSVVKFYSENNNNLYQTSKRFSLNTKTVLRWIGDEEGIKKSKKGSKHRQHVKPLLYPEIERQLYLEYKQLRKQGLKVKGYWFRVRAKQIMEVTNPESSACFSNSWFDGFKQRHKISLRRATNRGAIQGFHRNIREIAGKGDQTGTVGKFELRQIANVDQTPLPFSFASGETYADTGEKTIWVKGGASGLEKRQCTVQITLFADGKTRVKPMIIFRGKGKRISFIEKLCYDRRVRVTFQENAWCDEAIMMEWINQLWKPACSEEMMLVLDVHKAQKTDAVQSLLREKCKTEPVFVPAGTTHLVQPVDVVFNAPFKQAVDREATKHLHDNLDEYMRGTINASERRVLFTKWVGAAWDEVSANTDMVIRSFEKCGISIPIDGSKDDKINIANIDNYTISSEDEEATDASDEDEDPFSD